MALSEKQKQKKLAKKKQKRKVHVKALRSNKTMTGKAMGYADFQMHECLMSDNLFELGIGNVIISRRTPEGDIAISVFIVDVFCLGVKNALFKVTSEHDYEHTFKPQLAGVYDDDVDFESIHPSCARKLIEGAVQYAADLGFSSHPDYKNAKQIFGDIDSSVCPVKYNYGQDGKPYYMRGPNESINDAKKIIDKLRSKCGEDGFKHLLIMDE